MPVLLIGLVLVAALSSLRLADPAPIPSLRLAYFDRLQRIAPRQPSQVPVRIVDIDEGSLAAYGQWPWPRDRLAELTRRLAAAGASAVAYDVIFAEPDRLSPVRLAENPIVAPFLRDSMGPEALNQLDTDFQFARALETVPVVLGTARSGRPGDASARAKAEIALVGTMPEAALPELGPATQLVPVLAEAAKGIGVISVDPGANGAVTRTAPLLWRTPDGPIPSLALEALRLSLGEEAIVLWDNVGIPGTADHVTVGAYDIPTTSDGHLWLRTRHETPDAYIPAARVLSDAPIPDLDGAIVLVGTSAAGLLDLRTTALGETIPGVAVHAQAIEQILTGQHLIRSDFAGSLELLLQISAGLLVAAAMSLSGPVASVAVAIGSALAIVSASWAGFANGGLLIDATFPLLATFLTFSLLTLYRLFVTDRDVRLVRRSFSHYVAPDVLRVIETGGHKVALGGSDQPVTVMFSDIRNFTELSEALDAQGVVALLNRLFSGLSDEIMRNRGTIDKFMGDSVMAFWNAPLPTPDHALCAARAALAMRTALARFNAESSRPSVRMGLGLATGMACVGNIGSRDRFNYTAIGETVNEAARLEAACRNVEFDIVAGSAVREASEGLAWLDAGALVAKGVSARLGAAILVGDEEVAALPAFAALAAAHQAALSRLATGADATAEIAACRALAGRFPGLDAFYDRLRSRAGDFAPLPERGTR